MLEKYLDQAVEWCSEQQGSTHRDPSMEQNTGTHLEAIVRIIHDAKRWNKMTKHHEPIAKAMGGILHNNRRPTSLIGQEQALQQDVEESNGVSRRNQRPPSLPSPPTTSSSKTRATVEERNSDRRITPFSHGLACV
jgi:hypothetical protein